MSKGVTTPTVRVYQVHRGRNDRLKNKKSKDFPENRLVIHVTEPYWLESWKRLPKKIWGITVWISYFIYSLYFTNLENQKEAGEGDRHNGPETGENAVETIIVMIWWHDLILRSCQPEVEEEVKRQVRLGMEEDRLRGVSSHSHTEDIVFTMMVLMGGLHTHNGDAIISPVLKSI